MFPTSQRRRTPHHNANINHNTDTKPKFFDKRLSPFLQAGKRLSLLALLATAAPAFAQATLPEAIQAALTRADLSASDMSIVITPVGDKNASHLPSPIQVFDSVSAASTTDATTDTKASSPKNTQNPVKEGKKNLQNSTEYHSALTTIEKRTIKKYEQKIHAYTDDPYIYQSIESIRTPLADSYSSSNPLSNSNQVTLNDDRQDSNNSQDKTSSINISFSPLLSYQPDIARTPASTMKLVPSFIALDTLGADFVWHTRVYHTGVIVNDRLYGDLIIQGSGDPKMTHERLEQLLYQVQAAGIRHIDGDMIVDSAIFHNVTKDPAAFDNDPLRPYNASPDGFLVNFSTIGIKSYPADNGKAALVYTPQLANYQMPSTIETRSAACGQARYSLAPQWQPNRLVLNAALPNSCQEHAFYIAYPDAKEFAARVIAAKWQALGNTLSGDVISQQTPYDASKKTNPAKGLAAWPISPLPIVSYASLNLAQQIYDINHFSNNVMAEQVALSIGAYHQDNHAKVAVNKTNNRKNKNEQGMTNDALDNKNEHLKNRDLSNSSVHSSSLYQFGNPTTDYATALQTINQWWQTNLDTPPPYLTNGSGLCRECTITAANLSELLAYAYDRPNFDSYVNSLGVAGVSGTIVAHSDRLPDSKAIGRAWIKTGTLNNVTSMAGYVKGLSGQDYVIVGLINSEKALNAYNARTVLDVALDWTAQH
ncbi:D-alanyl-D-alanine carboxypeptidase/D-alanyl-D-alanine endopeptidase [Psychrobacter alimentarius]|uniref:D-alanyl-D-alanine carboxypeptidase/D-alanyl-D-alanine endopeptidase n=1 Tax=Psychrobacter alimentarius TaxID=261164 RepID=UPI001D117261|nr:D-alanyl-D-alanine carboxypeptidase/D-alanyl-D-alanine-endopeptidase [Psychrobacter alimentarius]